MPVAAQRKASVSKNRKKNGESLTRNRGLGSRRVSLHAQLRLSNATMLAASGDIAVTIWEA